MTAELCPLCGADLKGAPIPQEYIDKGYYGEKTHYSRSIMVEIRGVYDGGLYFVCPDCGGKYHRWPEGDWRHDKAKEYVDATD